MNHSISIYIFSLFFILYPGEKLFAQDTVQQEKVFYIAYDISKPVISIINKDLNQHEIGFGIKSGKKYNYAADLGYTSAFFKKNNYDWKVKGYYAKFGVNKVIYRDGKDIFNFGFRVAGSPIRQEYQNVLIVDSIFGNEYRVNVEPYNSIALWGEAIIKLDIHLKGDFSFGWMMRFKFPFYMPAGNYFKPYYVPGYGKTNGSAMIGINYCIYYNFPVKKRE